MYSDIYYKVAMNIFYAELHITEYSDLWAIFRKNNTAFTRDYINFILAFHFQRYYVYRMIVWYLYIPVNQVTLFQNVTNEYVPHTVCL
jgi:hypothetical protein